MIVVFFCCVFYSDFVLFLRRMVGCLMILLGIILLGIFVIVVVLGFLEIVWSEFDWGIYFLGMEDEVVLLVVLFFDIL